VYQEKVVRKEHMAKTRWMNYARDDALRASQAWIKARCVGQEYNLRRQKGKGECREEGHSFTPMIKVAFVCA